MSKPRPQLVIVGARGMGRQLAALIQMESAYEVVGYLDGGIPKGERVSNLPVLGDVEHWNVSQSELFLVALGDAKWRRHYVDILKKKGAHFATYISERAIVGEDVCIGEGTMVLPGVIITTNVKIGKHVILNISTSVSHDCNVGDFCTLSPGARIPGRCTLSEDVFLGVNSSLIPDVTLAAKTVVGAGAVVTKSYETEGVTLVGVPAKRLR